MIQLYDKETGAPLGAISEEQLQFLVDQLEEESPEDQDYYINEPTLDAFEEAGADPALLVLLRKALGDREEIEIRWARS
ncbi:MAG TPA: galactosyldiacylglycerol synthase [Verrucomicrobiae bacterium]|nr:galactosyldiacylglycerol synthase [Verrucomicrobiae bacterium]